MVGEGTDAIISWNFCSAGAISARVGANFSTSSTKGAVGIPRGLVTLGWDGRLASGVRDV